MAKKQQVQKQAAKPQNSSGVFTSSSEDYEKYRSWFAENWKMALLIFGFTFLVFFMKVHEEMNTSLHGEKSSENLYEVLGLPSTSTIKEIKKQFNKLAIEFHPDKHPNCTVCEEKYRKISAAYEVLSSEESKEHYDQTFGILEPIKSTTTSLYLSNFQKLVYETPYIWIVQVYSENSSQSQTFAGFWEDFALENDFINFGRVNFISQSKLVYQLPFAVDELPHVLSIIPGENSEVLEFSYDKSPNADLRNFLRKSLGYHYETLSGTDIDSFSRKKSLKKKVLLINFDIIPVIYQYLAYRYPQWFEFYSTSIGTHKAVQQQLKNDKATMYVVSERKNENELPNRVFTSPQNKNSVKRLLSYLMATSIPSPINRRPTIQLRGILRRQDYPTFQKQVS